MSTLILTGSEADIQEAHDIFDYYMEVAKYVAK